MPGKMIFKFGLLLLAASSLLGQGRILQLPFGKPGRLSSPDGRYVLFGRTTETAPELWVEDTRTSRRTRLLELGGTASAAWSPDGAAFYVNERWASDRARAYLYDAATLERVEIGKAILDSDSEAARFANGHAYFEVSRWEGPHNVAVSFHGHTDEAPVICFDLRYNVSRTGTVKKLTQHMAAVTEAGCK